MDVNNIQSLKRFLAATVVTLGFASGAAAGPILSAVGGTINSGGPGFGTLTETFDQTGLSSGYTSGVTDFDSYLATDPTHTLIFSGNEWFSNTGTSSASVTYDLGSVLGIDALALWNEESSGIGLLDLLGSTDGVTFSSIATGLSPFDNPLADYSAEVFSFAATNLRYFRMDMSDCPQDDPGGFNACAIGEVAFRGTEVAAQVPEPGTLALLALGLAGIGFRSRKPKAG